VESLPNKYYFSPFRDFRKSLTLAILQSGLNTLYPPTMTSARDAAAGPGPLTSGAGSSAIASISENGGDGPFHIVIVSISKGEIQFDRPHSPDAPGAQP
jgi:hypothetical protein